MWQAMAIQGAADAAKGMLGGIAADTAAYKQRTQALIGEQMQWDRNAADNKAIAEANLQNTIRTGYKLGLMNVQAAQAKKRALQSGFDLSKNRQAALGSATANAAAAGTIGSSVDAVIGDIEQNVQVAATQINVDYEQTQQNYDTQLSDLVMAGQDALRSSSKIQVQRAPEVAKSNPWAAVLGAAIDVGGQYLSSKMKLGLGTPGKAGAPTGQQSVGALPALIPYGTSEGE